MSARRSRFRFPVSCNVSRFGLRSWLLTPAEIRSLGWWAGYLRFRVLGRCDCAAPRCCLDCSAGWEAERAL